MDLQLKGRTGLVTGASQGLGRAIALALAAEGVRVAVVARQLITGNIVAFDGGARYFAF